MSRLLNIVAVIAAAATLWSCNTSGCTDNLNSLPLAGLYSSATGEAVTLDSLGVHGVGAPGDSMIIEPGTQVTQVYLPLRSQHASTAYCFSYRGPGLDDPALNDTITMVYSSWPYFNGEECGAAYRYNITSLDYTRHLIDSIALIYNEVTNVNREIMKIFLRTQEPDGPSEPDEPENPDEPTQPDEPTATEGGVR